MIKRFVKYIVLFSLLFIIMDLVLILITVKSLENNTFCIPENKNILIMGNSMLECAVNDSIIENCMNVSGSGEAYIYTYTKLKVLAEANPHIDTVLLAFGFNSVQARGDWQVFDQNGLHNIDRYCYFFNDAERELYKTNPYYYRGLLRLPYTYRTAVWDKLNGKKSGPAGLGWGEYLKLEKNKIQESIERLALHIAQMEITGDDYYPGSYQGFYLDKIIKYCNEKNIRLILVNAPVYMKYQYGVQEYYSYYQKYCRNTPLWDYSGMPLPDSCYADIYHINYKGSIIFSNKLKKRLTGRE